jgi:hypothetical protein
MGRRRRATPNRPSLSAFDAQAGRCGAMASGERAVWYSALERWELCFIGGSVSASVGGVTECVADAVVSLYVGKEKMSETISDAFGDFRFDGLGKRSGEYRVEICHAFGNAWRECELGDSVYLGEISLAESVNAVGVV